MRNRDERPSYRIAIEACNDAARAELMNTGNEHPVLIAAAS